MKKEYVLSNEQKREVINDLCVVGRDINKIYLKIEKKFELPFEIKEEFNNLSIKLSKIHAKLTKCVNKIY